MDVVDPAALPIFDDDHPTGSLRQRYYFEGEDGTPENYMFSTAETTGRFEMTRHRHNFDQFRMPLVGEMTMGQGRVLREGHIAYFPEGSPYGPQNDDAGPTALVLQFGGASGYGYMSMGQYRDGREALRGKGHFEGAVFVRNDGEPGQKKKFSINAIWEEALGERLLIPTPRYDQPIHINPAAFRWVPQPAPGTWRKPLGTFSERETQVEMWRIEPGATLSFEPIEAIRLLFVLQGAGAADDTPFAEQFAIRVQQGNAGTITASSETVMVGFVLPLLAEAQHGWTTPETPSFEPMPGESVPAGFQDS